jgi:hypothetical protein
LLWLLLLLLLLVALEFELGASRLLGSYSASPFNMMRFFKIGSQELLSQAWLWTMILLISASWVARITGVSPWCPAWPFTSVLIFNCHFYHFYFLKCFWNSLLFSIFLPIS